MYRFEWNALASKELVAEIESLAGSEPATDPGASLEFLGGILRATGGLPLARSEWDAAHCKAVALKLVGEVAVRFLRRRYQLRFTERGLYVDRRGERQTARLYPRLDPSWASAAALADLPVIGAVLAERIVEERRRGGPFTSMTDLRDRVSGFGEGDAESLGDLLTFGESDGRPRIDPTDLGGQLAILGDLVRSADPAAQVLEELLVFATGEPHPATRSGFKRDDLEPQTFAPPSPRSEAKRVQLLLDRAYYEDLPLLLRGASESIDVCMFFMALGGSEHPTRKLVDTLVERAAAGCRVRVLLDRDDVGDPYGSRLINADAARFLSENGVTVHHDKAERLLHSKLILLDDDKLVIGSHNWTAGSYLSYRDLSFLVEGKDAMKDWRGRFEALWAESFPYRFD